LEKGQPSTSRSPSDSSSGKRYRILIAEDSKADLFLIRAAIAAAKIDATLHVVNDGHRAVQFTEAVDANVEAPRPDLVLLDLNLPKKDGAEVLRHLRNSRSWKDVRVLIGSSSDSAREREAVESLGFVGYFRKPSAYTEFLKLGPLVGDLLAASERMGSE
jgi:CheY-like chemotaxis protein